MTESEKIPLRMNGSSMEKQKREETAMVPKAGWGGGDKSGSWDHDDDSADQGQCGVGACRPSFLQRFSGIKTFTAIFGLSAMFVGMMRTYLLSQSMWLERAYDLEPGHTSMLISCIDIGFLVLVLFLSAFVRSWHIPRTLSISLVLVGIGGLLCFMPYAIQKSDLTPPPNVTEETRWTTEKLIFMYPTCTSNPAMEAEFQKILFAPDAAKCDQDTTEAPKTTPPSKPPAKAAFVDDNKTPVENLVEKNTEEDRKMAYSEDDKLKQGPPPNIVVEVPEPPPVILKKLTTKAPPPTPAIQPIPERKPEPKPQPKPQPKPVQPKPKPTEAKLTPPPPEPTQIVRVPNFSKLKTHQLFPSMVQIAKTYNLDLEKLAAMEEDEQVRAMLEMPPEIQSRLPQLKLLLGENAESYFRDASIPAHIKVPSRKRRQAVDENSEMAKDKPTTKKPEPMTAKEKKLNAMYEKLKADQMWTGASAAMLQVEYIANIFYSSCTQAKIVELVNKYCPFNTGPFFEDTEAAASTLYILIAIGMVVAGIGKAMQPAFTAVYIDTRTPEKKTGLYIGIVFGLGALGVFLGQALGGVASLKYVTMEDVGLMEFLNPRWIGAWWLGFLIVAVVSFFLAIPVFFFPNPRDRRLKGVGAGMSLSRVIKGFFQGFMRLVGNPIFLLITFGNALSMMAVEGYLKNIMKYVETQFLFNPFSVGVYIAIIAALVIGVGVIVGGVISSCAKLSPFNSLKLVVALALTLVVLQAATLGMGCDQPKINMGDKLINKTLSAEQIMCSKTCVCMDNVYTPVCGSDNVNYFSPCHAGCGHPLDGEFHFCKCIPDEVQTAKPGLCPMDCQSGMFIGYSFIVCLAFFILAIIVVPAFLATFRSVERQDAALAVGVNFFFVVLIGVVPSSMIYDKMFEGICEVERLVCGPVDPCALYDLTAMRLRFNGLGTGLKAAAFLFYLLAMLLGFGENSVFSRGVHEANSRR